MRDEKRQKRHEEIAAAAYALLDEILPLAQPVRLVGLTLSAFDETAPPTAEVGAVQRELPF